MKVSIVVSCFNEEKTAPLFFGRVEKPKGPHEFEYLFIDNGSEDGTLATVKELATAYPYVRFVSSSRNFGEEAALYVGSQTSIGNLVIVIDVDL